MNEFISDLCANVQFGAENFYKKRIIPNTKKYISMELVAIALELYFGSMLIENKDKKIDIDFKNSNIQLISKYDTTQILKKDTLRYVSDIIK